MSTVTASRMQTSSSTTRKCPSSLVTKTVLCVYTHTTREVRAFTTCSTGWCSRHRADPDSKNGQELICRTEFHGQVEYRASVTIARRTADDLVLPQSKLLCGTSDSQRILPSRLTKGVLGSADGSLSTLTAVDEAAFKRLQLLQGQLTGKVQHVAGLNPRAFRYARLSSSYVRLALMRGWQDRAQRPRLTAPCEGDSGRESADGVRGTAGAAAGRVYAPDRDG